MIRSARLIALAAASLATSATAQDGAGAVPPVDPPEFAAKSIDQMTADEVLKLVRFSYTLYNRDFKGALRMGITKKVDFLLSLKPEAIRFIFNEPAQVILLDTREQRFALYEGIDGAELKQVPAAKYGEAVRGTDVTYEDLSMRFLYWPGARIIEQEKLKGRDTIRVGLRNPMERELRHRRGLDRQAQRRHDEDDRLRPQRPRHPQVRGPQRQEIR